MATSISREQVQVDPRTPSYIRVIAHTMEATSLGSAGNHWDILFILSDTESIRANMTINPQNSSWSLDWQVLNACYTSSTLQFWDFRVTPETRMGTIAQLIYGLGRDKYDISNGGSCCRFWVLTVIGDLASWGYIESNAKEKLRPNMLFIYYTSYRPAEALHMVEGTFHPRLLTSAEYTIYNLPNGTALQFEINHVKKQTWLKDWGDYADFQGRWGRRHKEYNLYFMRTVDYAAPRYGSMTDFRTFAANSDYISANYLSGSNYQASSQAHTRSVSSPVSSRSAPSEQTTSYTDPGTMPPSPSPSSGKKVATSYSALRYSAPMYALPYTPANYSSRSVSDPVRPSSGYKYSPFSSPNSGHSRTDSSEAEGSGKHYYPDHRYPPQR